MAWDNIISRSAWVLMQPSNFLIFVLAAGVLLSILSSYSAKYRKSANLLIYCSVFVLALSGFTNFSTWLLWPLEGRFVNYTNKTDLGPSSGIIVLAGSEKPGISGTFNQVTFSDHGERLTETVKLARMFPNLPIIHSGGTSRNGSSWTENDVAKLFFENSGIDLKRVRFESESYNTYTNATETEKLITPNENDKWFLVTSAFHMPRSVAAFQETTINFQPYPVGYLTRFKRQGLLNLNVSENLMMLDWAIHEYIGLFAYYITGRSGSLFPS
jgi:uncharacterized SAM-binding protein YcdF (DUF218 family)